MNDMNEFQKYKEASIYSMSSAELLQLLYDEAVSRLSKAEIALEDQAYDLFDDCLLRVSRIVRYLDDILDMRQPLSRDLRRIYNYLIMDLSRVKAGRERQKDEIPRIRNILSELGGAFAEAGKKAADVHPPYGIQPQERGIRG